MTSLEKKTIRNFLNTDVPREFLNSSDKLMFNEFLKGVCSTFIETYNINCEALTKIISLKNELYRDIDFLNDENSIYYNYVKLVISIMKKYEQFS